MIFFSSVNSLMDFLDVTTWQVCVTLVDFSLWGCILWHRAEGRLHHVSKGLWEVSVTSSRDRSHRHLHLSRRHCRNYCLYCKFNDNKIGIYFDFFHKSKSTCIWNLHLNRVYIETAQYILYTWKSSIYFWLKCILSLCIS